MKKNIVKILLFSIVFLLLFLPMKKEEKEYLNQNEDKDIVIFGDSLVGKYRDETGIAKVVEKNTKEDVYNCAIGGTCLASLNEEYANAYYLDSTNLYSLTKAVANEDYIHLDTALRGIHVKGVEYAVVELLKKIDFKKVDIVIISQGLNDYMSQIPPFASEGETEYTCEGALRLAISNLRSINPLLRIIIVTPVYNCFIEKEKNNPDMPYPFSSYIEMEEKVASDCSVEFVNMYEKTSIIKDQQEVYLTTDKIHLNEAGRNMYGTILSDYLNQK